MSKGTGNPKKGGLRLAWMARALLGGAKTDPEGEGSELKSGKSEVH